MARERETFGSRFGSVMALMGVAVGLANVWRFPYMAGSYGGAAFVLLYIFFGIVLGIPAVMAEWTLGRFTRQGPAGAFVTAGMPGAVGSMTRPTRFAKCAAGTYTIPHMASNGSQARSRRSQWSTLDQNVFDVAIIGGGINGACLYHHLCRAGFSVVLLDKGDFASGTSQGSAMMIWGGLLYLQNGDLSTVRRLCASRERMLEQMGDWVKPRRFRYVTTRDGSRSPGVVHAALYLYWLLGGCRRARPRKESEFPERGFLTQTVS